MVNDIFIIFNAQLKKILLISCMYFGRDVSFTIKKNIYIILMFVFYVATINEQCVEPSLTLNMKKQE
jgi:hypothetical protein